MKKEREIDLAAAFKALSNENRLKVFEIIRRGRGCAGMCKKEELPKDIPRNAVCVCEILALLDVTAPTLSHHLKELRGAGLVDACNHGQWSYYVVPENVLEKLRCYFAEPKRRLRK